MEPPLPVGHGQRLYPRRRGLHPLGPGKVPLPGLRSFRRGSSPEKGTLGSPARLQAPSQRLAVATTFFRVVDGAGLGWTKGRVFSLPFWRWWKTQRRGGGAERRQWRMQRGGSPVSKGVEGCRLGGDAQRPLRTAGAERRQWRIQRGGSPVSKGVEGSRLGGNAQRPLRTARGAEPPTGSRGRAPAGTHPPYLPTQKREKIRWITASSTVLPVMRPRASRALRRSVARQSGSGA